MNLGPLLRESFAWHDKDGNLYLDVGESVEFFSNYVKHVVAHADTILYLATYFRMDAAKAATEVDIMESVDKLIKEMGPDMLKAFDEDWQQRCGDAFQLLDVNNDQKLSLLEVQEGFLPWRPKHWLLLDALKFVVPMEAPPAAAGEEAAAGAADAAAAGADPAEAAAAEEAPAEEAPAEEVP